MILKTEFQLLLFYFLGYWSITVMVGDELRGEYPVNFLRIILIWYINSLLKLIEPSYRSVLYQRECSFILNISLAICTVVLSLSPAAIMLERGKSSTYGTDYHNFVYGFQTSDFIISGLRGVKISPPNNINSTAHIHTQWPFHNRISANSWCQVNKMVFLTCAALMSRHPWTYFAFPFMVTNFSLIS